MESKLSAPKLSTSEKINQLPFTPVLKYCNVGDEQVRIDDNDQKLNEILSSDQEASNVTLQSENVAYWKLFQCTLLSFFDKTLSYNDYQDLAPQKTLIGNACVILYCFTSEIAPDSKLVRCLRFLGDRIQKMNQDKYQKNRDALLGVLFIDNVVLGRRVFCMAANKMVKGMLNSNLQLRDRQFVGIEKMAKYHAWIYIGVLLAAFDFSTQSNPRNISMELQRENRVKNLGKSNEQIWMEIVDETLARHGANLLEFMYVDDDIPDEI